MSEDSLPSSASPHCFRAEKYFRAVAMSCLATASWPACATAAHKCFNNPSWSETFWAIASRSAAGSAPNCCSVLLKAELAGNSGRVLQSAERKLLTAVFVSPACQAVRADWATGASADGGAVADETLCLPQPAKSNIETSIIALKVCVFIKCNLTNYLTPARSCRLPKKHEPCSPKSHPNLFPSADRVRLLAICQAAWSYSQTLAPQKQQLLLAMTIFGASMRPTKSLPQLGQLKPYRRTRYFQLQRPTSTMPSINRTNTTGRTLDSQSGPP